MKALVLGDIHGNLIALEEVLKCYKTEVDLLISHGDVVNYGPWSNECVQLLAAENAICLLGNHEDAFIAGAYPGSNPLVQSFFQHIFPEFTEMKTIKGYHTSHQLDDYQIVHTINDRYYYPDSDVTDLNLEQHTIIGHSHYQFHKILANGKAFVNTGSVGQNRKDLSKADFVILDTENQEVELFSHSYDPLPVLQEMKAQKYPRICMDYYRSKLPT